MQFFKLMLLAVFCWLCAEPVLSKDLSQVNVDQNDIIISSLVLDKKRFSGSVDIYQVNSHYLVAIEPFLDLLQLRYQISSSQLIVWKNDQPHTYRLTQDSVSSESLLWADDGYYQLIDLRAFEILFGIKTNFEPSNLAMLIESHDFKFPVTVLAEALTTRALNRSRSGKGKGKGNNIEQIKITVPDQYRLFTLPHGKINARFDNRSKGDTNFLFSTQIVSDLLYHSMTLNLNKNNNNDILGNLTLSKYKNTPDDRVLGVFDKYSVGDVSSFSNTMVTGTGRGVGISASKTPMGFRRSNSDITIDETGPPGWEVELFRNNEFVDSMIVPESGSIIFNDVLLEWGNNKFELRLYGPYGEREIIERTYRLESNPLAEGDSAYGLYVFDPSQTLLGNELSSSIKLNNVGGYFDYGVSDKWQVGVGINQIGNLSPFQDDEQIMSLKNYLQFPGLLLETDMAFNNDLGYAQKTTLIGNIFHRGLFNLSYQSTDNFESNRVNSNGKTEQISMRYGDRFYNISANFAYQYNKSDLLQSNTVSNSLSYSPHRLLRASHVLTYSQTSFTDGTEVDVLKGTANLSTSLFDQIRLSASINYDPKDNFKISKSSAISAQYNYKMLNGIHHNVSFQYRPIIEGNNSWNINYSAAWDNDVYRLSFNSSYNDDQTWSFGLNVNFFLGYDYHNNRALMSSNLNPHSATLNVNTYLDRQLNGYRDPLDYPLEGVYFNGPKSWEGILSGKNGRVILPGTYTNGPMSFSAKTKQGSQTINNDYVIYTHPGAVIDVNMPVYLETELSGYVSKFRNNTDLAARAMVVSLLDTEKNIIAKQKTDIDGYYEFLNVKPNAYQLTINKESLKSKSLTGDIIGFNLNTPKNGGYVELPDIRLEPQGSSNESGKEAIIDLAIENLAETLIWDEDVKITNNYFLMPFKGKSLAASHITHENNEPPVEKNNSVNEIKSPVLPLADNIGESGIGNIQNNNVKEMTRQNKFYSIQLGAFNAISSASKFLSDNNFDYPSMALVTSQKNKALLKAVHRVMVGQFTTREQATTQALVLGLQPNSHFIVKMNEADIIEKTLLTTTVESPVRIQALINESKDKPMNNWVVQLYAGKTPIQQSVIKQFTAITKPMQATKIVAGEQYYCLISQAFNTKIAALSFAADNNLGDWAVELKNYQSVLGE